MNLFYLFLGIISGILSGFLGIGGGSILIPAFVYLLGLSQHQAQGTTLALMVPPIGLMAALRYYFEGNVNLKIAFWVCIGFFFGAFLGADFAQKVSDTLLKKIFGFFLLLISLKMIFAK